MKASTPPGRNPVRIAIVGTGWMAPNHAKAFGAIRHCEIVGATDLHPRRLATFCKSHRIAVGYPTLESLLAESGCDAVSVVTPDRAHAPVAIACLKRGLHVLCEKPLAITYAEAARMVAAARRARTVNMVNFSYRGWPALHEIAAAVSHGEIGELRHIEASYLQSWLTSKAWGDWRKSHVWLWRLSSSHGSEGVLGDVGVHLLDFVTYAAGPIRKVHCRLKTFSKAPGGRIGKYRLDANDTAVITADFAGGAVGIVHASRWASGHHNRIGLKLHGTKGAIWFDSETSTSGFLQCSGADLHRARWRRVTAPPVATIYEAFVAAIRSGAQAQPNFERGADINRLMEACRASAEDGRAISA